MTEPVDGPLSPDAAALYLGKTTSLLPVGAFVRAAPLSDFANMCNRGVGIARTDSDNRVEPSLERLADLYPTATVSL